MVRIVCQHCQKQLSIDETKLPNHEVSFQCPSCHEKVTYDRSKAAGAAAAAPPRAAAEPPPPAFAANPEHDDDDDEDFKHRALIVGVDSPAIRNAIRSVDMKAIYAASAEAGRETYLREYPPLVVLAPPQLTAPPLADMMPVTSVQPADRRKGFFVLVADNLKTLDGNAAFLYNVNVVVATRDLGSFKQIYRDATAYHKRLYQSMTSVLES